MTSPFDLPMEEWNDRLLEIVATQEVTARKAVTILLKELS